jgi:subtilase family serine protease
MFRTLRSVTPAFIASLLAACSAAGNSTPPTASSSSLQSVARVPQSLTPAQRGLWPRPGPAERVCGLPTPGFAACAAWVRTDIKSAASPSGYYPSDLQTAYGLVTASKNDGKGVTVAIVDAYDDPNAASDLNTYRAQFGLPAMTCAGSTPCFTKIQFGRRTNIGWAEEESLDVDMVSAVCPNCNILLVEAATNSTTNLTTAEQYATAHAYFVSNSWSGNESTTTSSVDGYYQIDDKVVTAATGDSGYNRVAQWPAILPGVVGVGGTSLTSISPRTESAWSGAGSGCSTIYAKPSYQQDVDTGCSKRAQADASADADPNTGVAVYDSFHEPGWLVFGGTSVATPIVASVFALANNTTGYTSADEVLTTLYGNEKYLYDVTSGSNGSCGAPLCTAGTGWDGPTGLGSPSGISAF